MKKYGWVFLFFILWIGGCVEQDLEQGDILYDIRFPNAKHNEAEITLKLSNLDPVPVQFSMARTSPGRYALHEFAKNTYNVTATDENGDTLDVYQPDLHTWIVSGHDGAVHFSYTLYADHADGTYSGVNREHAHLNIPASLVWVQGLEGQSMTVEFHPPEDSNWDVATQLEPTDDPNTFIASNFDYLMDSPTELSDFDLREWSAGSGENKQNIRLAMHHEGTEEELDEYTEMAQKVVDEQIGIFGELPEFDHGEYTFIADYLPYVHGDGMEHRNSTILTSTQSLEEGALQNLFTLSHEFFHVWNVERIRPQTLEPFNFQQQNVSGELWFAEGFTSYYDDLTIRRAGITDNEKYAEDWAGTLNSVLNSPGNRYYNPIEMSMQAPFVDAARSVDAQNKSNTFISYYSWGAVLGLTLDLMLRTEFDDVTLDDYMRAMWQNYGKDEVPYSLENLETTLPEVTGDQDFAATFFERYIENGNHADLKELFAEAGFLLRPENPDEAVISFGSNKIDFEEDRPIIVENTTVGSPLYEAGMDRDDVLLSLDGTELTDARDLNRVLASHEPGDEVKIVYESLGEEYTERLTLAENPTLELIPYEEADREVTDKMQEFRERWLGSKSDN